MNQAAFQAVDSGPVSALSQACPGGDRGKMRVVRVRCMISGFCLQTRVWDSVMVHGGASSLQLEDSGIQISSVQRGTPRRPVMADECRLWLRVGAP
ncbi:hypothetical protein C2E23DRAFT_138990 [Lenzites betulinus]|nr:hypothetical protein C2E23DRAFT_138990 [Lenzites betulinus]